MRRVYQALESICYRGALLLTTLTSSRERRPMFRLAAEVSKDGVRLTVRVRNSRLERIPSYSSQLSKQPRVNPESEAR